MSYTKDIILNYLVDVAETCKEDLEEKFYGLIQSSYSIDIENLYATCATRY